MSDISFKEKIKLDKYYLDDNALSQTDFYDEASKAWALASQEKDKADEKLEYNEAVIAKEVRANPSKFGLDKATDKAIREVVVTDKRYIEALHIFQKAQHNLRILAENKNNLDHRSRMLNVMSELYKGSYFSSKAGAPLKETAIEKTKENEKESLKNNPRLLRKRNV